MAVYRGRYNKVLLYIIFTGNLDPDQAGRFVRPGVDPNCFDTLLAFLHFSFLKSLKFKKKLVQTADNYKKGKVTEQAKS